MCSITLHKSKNMIPKWPGPRHILVKLLDFKERENKSFGHLTNTKHDLKGYAGGW